MNYEMYQMEAVAYYLKVLGGSGGARLWNWEGGKWVESNNLRGKKVI